MHINASKEDTVRFLQLMDKMTGGTMSIGKEEYDAQKSKYADAVRSQYMTPKSIGTDGAEKGKEMTFE